MAVLKDILHGNEGIEWLRIPFKRNEYFCGPQLCNEKSDLHFLTKLYHCQEVRGFLKLAPAVYRFQAIILDSATVWYQSAQTVWAWIPVALRKDGASSLFH